MAQRQGRSRQLQYIERVLANGAVAEKGKLACIELATGEIKPGAADTTLKALGVFEQDLTGDGSKKVRVRLTRPVWVDEWANSGTDPVLDADFGELCYIEGPETVAQTDAAATLSAAGRVWGVTSTAVVVETGAP